MQLKFCENYQFWHRPVLKAGWTLSSYRRDVIDVFDTFMVQWSRYIDPPFETTINS